MKTMITLAAAALFAVSTTATAGDGLKVNADKSKIFWTGKKVTGEHTGTLLLKGGEIEVKDGKPVRVDLDLDMTTIVVTDITDEGTNAKLVGHLKSDDFFSVEKNPTGKFVATSFTEIKGAKDREPNYTVKGKLTLKGITQDIEFPAMIAVKGNNVVANGNVTFDRTKFEIKYGSGNFFQGLGDKAINDEVRLNFVFSAGK
jgi:polyisoprenoid-binding protein YceI